MRLLILLKDDGGIRKALCEARENLKVTQEKLQEAKYEKIHL